MRKALSGLVLAAGALGLPLLAHADCPTEDSIDRYTQTAGDALVALHELVPVSQQRALEDRYAAMIIVKWHWQGRDAIRADANEMKQLLSCYQAVACGIDDEDQITTQIVDKLDDYETDPLLLESLLPRQPSSDAFAWAQSTLDCVFVSDEIDETELTDAPQESATLEDPLPEIETVEIAEAEPALQISSPADNDQEREPPVTFQEAELIPAAENEATDIIEEAAVQTFAATSTPIKGDVDQLMLSAANLVAGGKPEKAIAPLESACFIEAARMEKSSACETLFAVYTNALAPSESSPGTQNYLDLSDRLCDSGYSRGCDNLSRHHLAQNSAESRRAAVSYAERSCQLSNAEACATVAEFYLSGHASKPDPVGARDMLEQSCRLGRLLSCQEVADYYQRGIGGEQDRARALQMVEASCPASTEQPADLCVSAADYVLINEPASPERSARVRKFIQRACAIGHGVGCAWYAEDLELGIGGEVDLTRARQARVIACEYGDQESCNSRS